MKNPVLRPWLECYITKYLILWNKFWNFTNKCQGELQMYSTLQYSCSWELLWSGESYSHHRPGSQSTRTVSSTCCWWLLTPPTVQISWLCCVRYSLSLLWGWADMLPGAREESSVFTTSQVSNNIMLQWETLLFQRFLVWSLLRKVYSFLYNLYFLEEVKSY